MSWVDLEVGILTEFADAQARRKRRVATEESGLEAIRKAWRDRQRIRGECRSCRSPAVNGRRSCARHLLANKLRALDAKARAA